MSVEKKVNDPSAEAEFIIGRAEKYLNRGNLKETVNSLASDIKDSQSLNEMQKIL